MVAPDGLLIVDKPPAWTSHDVVARCRRLAGTRKVGHAGTLDPMATGVLVVGVGRATRMLGHLALMSKCYHATIRLGQATTTDDADGEVVASVDAGHLSDVDLARAVSHFTGELQQAPSAVSAVKMKGKRAYARVRAGEDVVLPARTIRVSGFLVLALRRSGGVVDVDVSVECSTGTYVRALARDIGAELAVGGHLTALRRDRVGTYGIARAHTLEDLAQYQPADLPILSLDEAAVAHFAWYVVEPGEVMAVRNGRALRAQLRHPLAQQTATGAGVENQERDDPEPGDAGGWLPPDCDPRTSDRGFGPGQRGVGPAGPVAVLAPGGQFLALYEQRGPIAKAAAVFTPA